MQLNGNTSDVFCSFVEAFVIALAALNRIRRLLQVRSRLDINS